MEYRYLGRDHRLKVSAIGLGCMTMAGYYENIESRQNMINIIHRAYDYGVTLFDTAEVYGPYLDELLVGEALRDIRHNVVISTKCGIQKVDGKEIVCSNPDIIRSSIEGSLKRLQTDYIDLYFIHRVDPSVPIEEIAGVMKELFTEGKIRAWGISEPGLQTIQRAHKEFPLTAIQSEYSMMWRDLEKEYFPLLESSGIGLIPFSPLAKGFLTNKDDGNFSKLQWKNTRFSKENISHNHLLREIINKFAEEKGVTPAQIALAWVIAQKPWIVPIPGTTKMSRMEENVGAAAVQFSQEEMNILMNALNKFTVAGSRYTPGSDMEKRVRL